MNMPMLEQIRSRLSPHGTTLVAVSKTFPVSAVQEAYEAGCRDFGENKVQEMVEKQAQLPSDIRWHLIGHLQTNKVKYIAPFVAMIHSVDSLRLLEEINKQSARRHRVIDCLLQFHIATEESKYGFSLEEAQAMLSSETFGQLQNVRICGVMGMATFTEDQELIRTEFQHLRSIFNQIKQAFFPGQAYFKEISMGMSGDWELALEEGSTMVRIGSLIFGERSYQ